MSDLMKKLRESRYNFFLGLGLFYFLPVITKLPSPFDIFFLRLRAWLRFSLGRYRAYVNRPDLKEIAIRNLMDTLEIDRKNAKKRLLSLMQLEVFAERNGMFFDTYTVSALEKHFTIHGLEKLNQEQRKGKGIIFVTVHSGDTELFLLFMALKGYNMYGLFDGNIMLKTARNPLEKFAKLKDAKITGRVGKLYAGSSLMGLFDALRNNGIIIWMVDVPAASVKRRSIISFFGARLTINTSFWEVAYRAGASLVPFINIYDHKTDHYETSIGDPVDTMKNNFQDLFVFFETHLKKSPESWAGWYFLDLLKLKDKS